MSPAVQATAGYVMHEEREARSGRKMAVTGKNASTKMHLCARHGEEWMS